MSEIQYPVIGSSGWGEIMNNNLRELDTRTGGSSGDITGRLDTLEDNITQLNDDLTETNDNVAQLSNPNLFINGDFKIWQRGTSFGNTDTDNKVYTADRWKFHNMEISQTGKIIKSDNGLKYTIMSDNSHFIMGQILEEGTIKKSTTYTATVKLNDTNIDDNKWSIWVAQSTKEAFANGKQKVKDNLYTFTFTTPDDFEGDFNFAIGSLFENFNSGEFIDIEYFKLEIGDKATPFVPRSYGEELALCQRYYEPINRAKGTGIVINGNNACVTYPFFVEKRIVPTVPVPTDLTNVIEVLFQTNVTPIAVTSQPNKNAVRFTTFLSEEFVGSLIDINFNTYADAEIY